MTDGEEEVEEEDDGSGEQSWWEEGVRWRWRWGILEYVRNILPPPGMSGPGWSVWHPAPQFCGRVIDGYIWTRPNWPWHGGFWQAVTAGARREERLRHLRASSRELTAWFRHEAAWRAEAALPPSGPAPLYPPSPPRPSTPDRKEAKPESDQVCTLHLVLLFFPFFQKEAH